MYQNLLVLTNGIEVTSQATSWALVLVTLGMLYWSIKRENEHTSSMHEEQDNE